MGIEEVVSEDRLLWALGWPQALPISGRIAMNPRPEARQPGSPPGEPPASAGPPFDLDTVADLQAGVYPNQVATELRRRVIADPDGSRMLAALQATVTDLEQLPRQRMPDDVAARLDAALAAEAAARSRSAVSTGPSLSGLLGASPPTVGEPRAGQQPDKPASVTPEIVTSQPAVPVASPGDDAGPGRVISLDAARTRRRSRWATGLGMAAAVAAVATVVIVAVRPFGTTGGAGLAGGPADLAAPTSVAAPGAVQATPAGQATATSPLGQALVMVPGHLDEAFNQIRGIIEAGEFADPDLLAECLAANNDEGKPVLGVRKVTYRDQDAYAISVGLDSSTAEILVVGAGCGPQGAQLLDKQRAPR